MPSSGLDSASTYGLVCPAIVAMQAAWFPRAGGSVRGLGVRQMAVLLRRGGTRVARQGVQQLEDCSGERRALFVVYRAAHYAPGEDRRLALGCAVHKPCVRKGAAAQMQSQDANSEFKPSWQARQEQ
jgi:hypothetical protein